MTHPKHLLIVALTLILIMFASITSTHAQADPDNIQVSWSPNGLYVAIGSGDRVTVVDAETMQELYEISNLSNQFAPPVWSPDSNSLAIANRDFIEIWHHPWDVDNARLMMRLQSTPYAVRSIAWHPQGTQIAAANDAVEVWDVMTGDLLYRQYGHRFFITQIAWSSDGSRLATASADRTVNLWDATTGEVLSTMRVMRNFNLPPAEIFVVATAVAWHPNNETLVFGAEDGTIRLWDTASLNEREVSITESSPGVFRVSNLAIRSVAWDPAGTQVAGASRDGWLAIWNPSNEAQIEAIQTNLDINTISYSPYGGRLLVSGNSLNQEQTSARLATVYETLDEGTVQIIIPDPSLERLQSIAQLCGAPADFTPDPLEDFIAHLDTLDIPPACRADLLAIAAALQAPSWENTHDTP